MVGDDGAVFWVLLERLDKIYHYPDIPKYSQEDEKEFARSQLDKVLLSDAAQTKFGDLWERTTFSALLAVEEGFLEQWSLGRVVCIGDSVHKVCSPHKSTPDYPLT